MIARDLSPAALRRRLAGAGLALRTGPLVFNIRSPLAEVADGIALHYANHPLEAESTFVDFHVSVERPAGLRRWVNRQVVFRFDGELPFAPLPGHQGFPLLEWGLNWCIHGHCHQYLILHGAVVAKGGAAAILPAPSGSGKSTLCAGLAFRGWSLLSDELTVIDPVSRDVLAVPRPISLKNASIEVIRRFAPDAVIGPSVPDTTKGTVAHVRPPPAAVAGASLRATPRWVVLPQYEAGAAATLTRLSRASAFMTLVDNAFNYNIHGAAGFAALAALIDRCDCYSLRYGDLEQAVALFDRLAAEAQP